MPRIVDVTGWRGPRGVQAATPALSHGAHDHENDVCGADDPRRRAGDLVDTVDLHPTAAEMCTAADRARAR
jgi:hypothetical protein